MMPRLLVHPNLDTQIKEANKLLVDYGLSFSHPDLLYLNEEKLGVEEAKRVREHFALKPYSAKGRMVIVIGADKFSIDAQNSLLKTLEEPPEEARLILTCSSESALLPTIISRCQIVYLGSDLGETEEIEKNDLAEKFLKLAPAARFEMIETIDDKDQLLRELLYYYSGALKKDPNKLDHAKLVLKADEWQKSNVSIRSILEYLSLSL